jgi:hypothetical protein
MEKEGTSSALSLAYEARGTYYISMCSYCGSPMPADRPPGFNETCDSCGKDLHACLNCRFYKTGARWDCVETIDEPVPDKDRRNRCDWYQTNQALLTRSGGRSSERSAAEKARDNLDRLFGG